jgi:hypothetical protein
MSPFAQLDLGFVLPASVSREFVALLEKAAASSAPSQALVLLVTPEAATLERRDALAREYRCERLYTLARRVGDYRLREGECLLVAVGDGEPVVRAVDLRFWAMALPLVRAAAMAA